MSGDALRICSEYLAEHAFSRHSPEGYIVTKPRSRASNARSGLRHSSIRNLGTTSLCNPGFESAPFHAQDLRSSGVPSAFWPAPLRHRLCVDRSEFYLRLSQAWIGLQDAFDWSTRVEPRSNRMYRHTSSSDNRCAAQNLGVFGHHFFCSHQRPQAAIDVPAKIGKTNRQKVAFARIVLPLLHVWPLATALRIVWRRAPAVSSSAVSK
jgi:hypothetical protein